MEPEVEAARGREVQAERDAEVILARLGYLGAVFTGPVIPLGVYLIGRRVSPFTRYHAAMALNQSLTGLLYAVCCLILGGLLLLDSLDVALAVALPIAVWLWICTAGYLLRGMAAANRGEPNPAPAWICARIVRTLPAHGVTGPRRSRPRAFPARPLIRQRAGRGVRE